MGDNRGRPVQALVQRPAFPEGDAGLRGATPVASSYARRQRKSSERDFSERRQEHDQSQGIVVAEPLGLGPGRETPGVWTENQQEACIMKRTVWFVLASLALLLVVWTLVASGSTPSVSAQGSPTVSPDLAAIPRKLVNDLNKGDIAGVMAPFTDDATIEGQFQYVGKAAIQQFYEGQVSAHNRLDLVACVSGADNTVQVMSEVRGDKQKALGIERIVLDETYKFIGTKISPIVITAEPSDPQTTAFFKAQQPDPETLYRKMVDALNKGEVANAAAAFTNDAVLINPNCPATNPCVGKAGLQANFDLQAQSHTHVDILAVSVSGNTLQAVVDVRGDVPKALGVDRLILNGTATFTGDKMSRLVLLPEPSDPQTMSVVSKAPPAQPTSVPK